MRSSSGDGQPSWQSANAFVLVLGAVVATGGLLSLAGWFSDTVWLKDWFRTGITIKANTALAIVLSGLGLAASAALPRMRWLVIALGATTALIGGLTLSQHVVGWDLRIDGLLVVEPPGARATAAPGRMGPPASSSFLLIGLALILLTGGSAWRRCVPLLAVTSLTIALLSLTGYLYGAEFMYTVPKLTGIAVQTAVMLVAINVGLLASIREYQPARMVLEPGTAGLLARRMLPAIVLLPLAVGWFRLLGQNQGWYDTEFGAALRTLIEIGLLAGLSWWMLVLVRDHEAAARESERRKDEFLALLAHELRNPLAPVMNTLAFLERERSDDSALRDSLDIIRRQMQHMVRLVDDLLDVGRISKGKLELRKTQVDLGAVVQQAVEMTRPLADQANHGLTVELPEGPLWVYGDHSRLAQTVGNILNNACRFTRQGGRISVRGERHGGEALLTIADNGIGLPADKLDSIFEMFTQLDGSLERNVGGLGLGLHLVKQLVEMHGGRVQVKSSGAGQGSEFLIRLPLILAPVSGELSDGQPAINDERSAKVPKSVSIATTTEARTRILVVDDNRDSALTLSLLFKRKGNEVTTAFDGEEAVEKAASFQPEIILLDIGLPKLNGYEACRAIRAQASNSNLLIVALTGWGQEQDRRQAELAGFDAHLTKPVDHSLLAKTLDELQSRRART